MPEPTNFCAEYRVLNSGTEIPEIFTAWCSLSAISCILGRRVWIDMGPFKIYPNMFIVLIAGSGRMRKSTAVNVTRDMLSAVEPRPNFISEKITTEALYHAMKLSADPKSISLGDAAVPIGQGFVITDELTNFLNSKSNDGGIGAVLTRLYDCSRSVEYETKSRGKEMLRDTQLGLLAATTPEELRKAIPEESIGSGLASRILFVYESNPRLPVAFPTYTKRQDEASEFCVRFLQRAYTFNGVIKLSEEARAWCQDCYVDRCFKSPLLDDPYLRGYASRRYIHILKLAINLSVGLTETLELTPEILARAEALIIQNESHLSRVIQLVTMNEKGSVIQGVLALITKHKRISRNELMKQVSHRLDTRELTEVIETLNRSHEIQIVANGTNIYYEVRA